MHTPQSLFDAVARHLLTQRACSYLPKDHPANDAGNGCAYRGENGLRCAIGALIPDDRYSPEFEGLTVRTFGQEAAMLRAAASLPDDRDDPLNMLAASLQRIHDGTHPNAWARDLRAAAERYSLDPAVLGEFEEVRP